MDVSMKRSGMACCEKVYEYSQPVEQAAETVVPDTMPDVERVLCAEGTVIIKSKEVQDGRVNLTAGVAATVLYAPEGGAAGEFLRSVRHRAPYPADAGRPELPKNPLRR